MQWENLIPFPTFDGSILLFLPRFGEREAVLEAVDFWLSLLFSLSAMYSVI